MNKRLSFATAALLLSTWLTCSFAAVDAKKTKPAAKADAIPAEAKATLEEAGFKVTTGGLSLPDEVELGKEVRESAKQKKAMMAADREVYAAQRELNNLREQMNELKVQMTNLSAELTRVTDAVSNNRIVGALRATDGQIDLLVEQSKQSTDRLKEARKKANEIRETYVQDVLEMRSKADDIAQKWDKSAADGDIKAALDKINDALGTKFVLKPSTSFGANLKQLKTMEEAVSSEAIKLENERNSLWVNVMVNGKHSQRMIVDSGANCISLPDKMIKDMGIEIGSSGVPVRVSLADGREVPATLIKLASVRVGKFTVEDVECCVLGREAPDAPPLLGMSFLGQFKFEVDSQQAELKLVKVDSGEPVPKEKGSPKSKMKKKK
ncbi:MAG TPA: TIGR02281 family clan AA aspartic protease [Planctomycetaceae bacterium]